MDLAMVEAAARAGFSPEETTKLPAANLVSISKNGEVVIKFSKEIDFPKKILEPVEQPKNKAENDSRTKGALLQAKREKFTEAENLLIVEMIEGEEEKISENLTSWNITSITKTELRITLNFAKPILVSQGDIKDSLLISARFGAFKDEDGIHFPEFIFLLAPLPLQNPSAEEIIVVEQIATAASTGTAAIIGSNLIVNVIFSVSMASLWSMFEILQIIVFVPLFEMLKFPANA